MPNGSIIYGLSEYLYLTADAIGKIKQEIFLGALFDGADAVVRFGLLGIVTRIPVNVHLFAYGT